MAARKHPENNGRLGKGVKHGENLIQRTRAAILNTFDAVESRGRKISEILADEFEKNPIKFMELAAKAMPKEISGEFNHTHTADKLTDDQLADIATAGSRRASKAKTSQKALH